MSKWIVAVHSPFSPTGPTSVPFPACHWLPLCPGLTGSQVPASPATQSTVKAGPPLRALMT